MEFNPILKRLGAALAAFLLIVFGIIWFAGAKITLKLERPVEKIGQSTAVLVEVNAPHGVKAFSAAVEQNGQSQSLYRDGTHTRQRAGAYEFYAGQKQAAFLKEGDATLVIEARSNDLRGAKTELRQNVEVILRAPSISADGVEHLINQGGSELVTLELGGNWSEAGVKAGKYTATSFAMPGQPDTSAHRFSLFPYPWDLPSETQPMAFARNGAGTEVTANFTAKIFPKKFRESTIHVTDRNLEKVDSELDTNGAGNLVERFVKINRDMRRANTEFLYKLRTNTAHKILWNGPFVPVKGARESFFADRRTYVYNGQKIDEQVHLGYDLAQTAHSPVKAANAGKVIFAGRLGLYGNCVVIDHGYSLESLYGHMSSLGVKAGDSVAKEQQIGVSGSTGMAFGDHVHFSMLVDGIQVDPKEWWDEHWIHDRILSKLSTK